MGFETRGFRSALREGLLLAIGAAASFAFLYHGLFYLDGRPSSTAFRIEPFLFVTGLSYLFLRFVVLAVELRPARDHMQPIRCPKCGQWIDDASARKLAAHRKIETGPKSTKKEVGSPNPLRRAVDAVRFGTRVRGLRRMVEPPAVLLKAENLTGRDLVAALDDPDFLARNRHGPAPPPERRTQP